MASLLFLALVLGDPVFRQILDGVEAGSKTREELRPGLAGSREIGELALCTKSRGVEFDHPLSFDIDPQDSILRFFWRGRMQEHNGGWAPGESCNASGGMYLYVFNGASWVEQTKLSIPMVLRITGLATVCCPGTQSSFGG